MKTLRPTESARQRFNVAVSRARDLLWLHHTAPLDMLSDACMRHRLLVYAAGRSFIWASTDRA